MKLLILLFLFSCGSAQKILPKLSPDSFYKRDMIVTINGETFEGVGVTKEADKYDFHVEARGDLDMFIMTSCHKEETKERAWNVKKKIRSGLFGWGSKKIDLKREVKFTFHPNSIERDGDCTIGFGGYEASAKGRHSWAFVDFESEKYKLPAKVNCNGREIKSSGTTVCQARQGLIQDIEFNEETIVADNNSCGIVVNKSKKYEFAVPLRKCVAIFMGVQSKKIHKLTLVGYEKILIRE